MNIAIASDHAGFTLKNELLRFLNNSGYTVQDYGADSEESMDYPDTVVQAARAVSEGKADRAVVICGSGIGASIVANKVRGIRCALCSDIYDAEYSRRHNDANAIALGARKTRLDKAEEMLLVWFGTAFEGGRHETRLNKIRDIEDQEGSG